MQRLERAPRRRDFETVPMILNAPDQWDSEALNEVLAYKPVTKQVWDNTDIGGPWLNLMRNVLNTQVWGFGHPDFLIASATRGTAHLALYDAAIWDKYQIGKLRSFCPCCSASASRSACSRASSASAAAS